MGDALPPEPDGPEGDGTRFKRLFVNSSIYAIGEMGLQVLTAIFTPLLTFYLAPAELGVWSLALMLFTGFSTLCGLALAGAVTRFYYDHEFDAPVRRRFQGTILSFMLIWSLFLCVSVTVFGPEIFEALFTDLPFYPYGAFIVWMTFIGVAGIIPKALWAASEQAKIFVGISALGAMTNVAGSLSLVIFAGIGVMGLFWGKTVSLLILSVPFIVWTARHVGFAWHWGDLKSALRFSLPLVPHLLAHWVLGMSDRFIIDHHYGAEGVVGAVGTVETVGTISEGATTGLSAVGIYSAAYVFIGIVNMVAMAMNRAWVPQFTRAYDDESQRPFVARSITYFLLAVGAITVVLLLLSAPVILGFFDERYAQAAEISPILAAGGLFQGIYYIYVAGLFYFKKNRLIPIITVISGAANVALNLLWLPKYGLVGVAWATLVGYLILAVGVRWGCRLHTRLPFERARIFRLVLALGAVSGIGLLAGAFLPLWSGLAAKIVAILSAPFVLHALGFWDADEIAWAKAKLPKFMRR